MKALILLELENGKSSVVVVEHETDKKLLALTESLLLTPEVRRAKVLAANLNGRIVIADQNDSPETLTQIASW